MGSREKDDVQKLFETELNFIEACLKVNPKSYGSWHHRTWVTARMPRPDWTRELGLCDRCLSLDERNCKNAKLRLMTMSQRNLIHLCFLFQFIAGITGGWW